MRYALAALLVTMSRTSALLKPSVIAHGRTCRRASTESFDGLSCSVFKLGKLKMGEQAQRLSRYAELKALAAKFVERKNAKDLASIFASLAPDASVYGLTGDAIESGLTEFFAKHRDLQHDIEDEPMVSGDNTVEYRFVKSWIDGDTDERVIWLSRDPSKPRDKVERLVFVGDKLLSADVVSVASQSGT